MHPGVRLFAALLVLLACAYFVFEHQLRDVAFRRPPSVESESGSQDFLNATLSASSCSMSASLDRPRIFADVVSNPTSLDLEDALSRRLLHPACKIVPKLGATHCVPAACSAHPLSLCTLMANYGCRAQRFDTQFTWQVCRDCWCHNRYKYEENPGWKIRSDRGVPKKKYGKHKAQGGRRHEKRVQSHLRRDTSIDSSVAELSSSSVSLDYPNDLSRRLAHPPCAIVRRPDSVYCDPAACTAHSLSSCELAVWRCVGRLFNTSPTWQICRDCACINREALMEQRKARTEQKKKDALETSKSKDRSEGGKTGVKRSIFRRTVDDQCVLAPKPNAVHCNPAACGAHKLVSCAVRRDRCTARGFTKLWTWGICSDCSCRHRDFQRRTEVPKGIAGKEVQTKDKGTFGSSGGHWGSQGSFFQRRDEVESAPLSEVVPVSQSITSELQGSLTIRIVMEGCEVYPKRGAVFCDPAACGASNEVHCSRVWGRNCVATGFRSKPSVERICKDCGCREQESQRKKSVAASQRKYYQQKKRAKEVEAHRRQGAREGGSDVEKDFPKRRNVDTHASTSSLATEHSSRSSGIILFRRYVSAPCEVVAKRGATRCDPVACGARPEVACSRLLTYVCRGQGMDLPSLGQICGDCICREHRAEQAQKHTAGQSKHWGKQNTWTPERKYEGAKETSAGKIQRSPGRGDASPAATKLPPAPPGNAASRGRVLEPCEIVAKPGATDCDPVACGSAPGVICSRYFTDICRARGFDHHERICGSCMCRQNRADRKRKHRASDKKRRVQAKLSRELEKSEDEGAKRRGAETGNRSFVTRDEPPAATDLSPTSAGSVLSRRAVSEECQVVAKPGAERCDPVVCAARSDVSCNRAWGGYCMAYGFTGMGDNRANLVEDFR